MPALMFHDDNCGELLDCKGRCPRCGFSPDMQSTAFKEVETSEVLTMLDSGRSFMGKFRVPIEKRSSKKQS